MALKLRFKLNGDVRLRRKLRQLGNRAPKFMGRAFFIEAESIMTVSKRLVPVDTGALRASGHVQPPEIRGQKVRVVLAYGGTAAPYAVFVHENPGAHHKPPTGWKYLERPFNEAQVGMAQRIGNRVWRDLRREAAA